MNKMLINATQPEELRVALVKNERLDNIDVERHGSEQKKANIYKGKISRLEPSLGAAFVDYGAERHGFLPLKEIEKSYFKVSELNQPLSQYNIKDLLSEGQEVMIQVDKEERGNKGAALTTFVSLAGSFLVLMPNNARAGGISRRIEGRERDELRDRLSKLAIPEDMGVIIRTAGLGKTQEELQWDLDALIQHWHAVKEAYHSRQAPFLIHRESDVVIRALRDNMQPDISEIITDSHEVYEKILQYMQQFLPAYAERVKYYNIKVPLFSHYQIEKQIETAYQRVVNLPSGGSIVIDPTEALVSVDVNSSKATGGKDIEETALNTNKEAADEIARQLRLRDIGGLIVIDFIDMTSIHNQREVTNHLRQALHSDRARVRIGNITRFGLMEMSRQRLRPNLSEAIQTPCPQCDGQGTIRSIGNLSLSIIRLLEEAATQEKTVQINAYLPIELATFIINEKREAINEIEGRQEIKILIIPSQYMRMPKYKIKRLRQCDLPRSRREVASYKFIEVPKLEVPATGEIGIAKQREVPAVQSVKPSKPAPTSKTKTGLLQKVVAVLVGTNQTKESSVPQNNQQQSQRSTNNNRTRSSNYRRNSSNSRYNNNKQDSSHNKTRRGSRGGQYRTSYKPNNSRPKSDSSSEGQKSTSE